MGASRPRALLGAESALLTRRPSASGPPRISEIYPDETMQVGILGFAKSGKTTLFNLLTASSRQTDKYAASRQTHVGVATVPDPRLKRLRDLYQPRRFTPATVTYIEWCSKQDDELCLAIVTEALHANV